MNTRLTQTYALFTILTLTLAVAVNIFPVASAQEASYTASEVKALLKIASRTDEKVGRLLEEMSISDKVQ